VKHEEFAERAGRRLEAVAERLEADTRRLGIHGEASGTRARAQEMMVAALLVREEALAVSEAEVPAVGSPEALAESPPLEAQA
jgi:hypothetical protein